MKIITFGEILLRLSPPGHERLFQSDRLTAIFGGAEANVAVSLAGFGWDAAFVTRLPDSPIGRAAVATLRGMGVDSFTVWGGDRVGLYYLEKGASQRGSVCVYDRAGSAIAKAAPGDFDWENIFRGADWFHFSGITPALGEALPEICRIACEAAKAAGVKISCDLNYRSKLWSREQARTMMEKLCPYADLLIANTGSAADVFGIRGANPVPYGRQPDPENVREVAKELSERFHVPAVGMSMRTVRSVDENDWSGMLYIGGRGYFAREYALRIVDRVGGGDSFAAGLIYGLGEGRTPQESIEFAVAASALKHSIEGDFNRVSVGEVLALVNGGSGEVSR